MLDYIIREFYVHFIWVGNFLGVKIGNENWQDVWKGSLLAAEFCPNFVFTTDYDQPWWGSFSYFPQRNLPTTSIFNLNFSIFQIFSIISYNYLISIHFVEFKNHYHTLFSI